jgi:hypothetical protein
MQRYLTFSKRLTLFLLALTAIAVCGDVIALGQSLPDTFVAAVANPSQFQESNYVLDFQLSRRNFRALSRGGFEIEFPQGTILDSIGDVAIDDDYPGISYRSDSKRIYDRTLILNLRRPRDNQTADDDDQHAPVAVRVAIEGIKNPQAGIYRIKSKAFNQEHEFTTGQLTSNTFVIFERFTAPQFDLVAGSIHPDTIYSHIPYTLSFEVSSIDSANDWLSPDSARITVTLPSVFPGHVLDTIFSGLITPSAVTATSLQYAGLGGVVEGPLAGGTSEYRTIALNYVAYKNGDSASLDGDGADSVFFFQFPEIQFVANSLTPDSALGGETKSFVIDAFVSSDYPLTLGDTNTNIQFWPRNNDTPASVAIDVNSKQLSIGSNSISTIPFAVPELWSDQIADVKVNLLVLAPGLTEPWEIGYDFTGNALTILADTNGPAVLQILNLEVLSPNSPRVNIGQSFALRATIANSSEVIASGVKLELQSDGLSHFDSVVSVGNIAAFDTVTLDIPITAASQPEPAEVFRVALQAGDFDILTPLNDIATVFVDLPAILALNYNLFGVQSGYVSPGDRFTLTVELRNNGDAPVTDAHFLLTTGFVEFGQNDSITGTILVEQDMIFNFDAPLFDTSVFFVFQLTNMPIDLNSALPAVVQRSAVVFPINVERIEGEVIAAAQQIGSTLVFPKTNRQFFSLNLDNQGRIANSRVDLSRLFLSVRDQNGLPINATSVLDISTVKITESDTLVATATAIGHRMSFTINDFILLPNQDRDLVLSATPASNGGESFVLSLNVDDVEGVYVAGPLANQRALIVSPDGSSNLFQQLFLFTEKIISESFRIETNPCNPDEQPVRFAYVLESSTDVEFRIFTLGGLEVYANDFSSGTDGGMQGEHVIEWDGKNSDGKPVMNGVYIASIKLMSTGEFVRRKVAIVR